MRKLPVVAIAYDFDGTLAPGNMQEHSFLPNIGMKAREFWKLVERLSQEHETDSVLTYMNLMLEKAREAKMPVRRQDFKNHGKSIKLFTGVDTWFGYWGWMAIVDTKALTMPLPVLHSICVHRLLATGSPV